MSGGGAASRLFEWLPHYYILGPSISDGDPTVGGHPPMRKLTTGKRATCTTVDPLL